MTIKTITFCDICNPKGAIGQDRRNGPRQDSRGRRHGDHCSWLEGGEDEIIEQGWVITSKGKHVCPKCLHQHKDAVFST